MDSATTRPISLPSQGLAQAKVRVRAFGASSSVGRVREANEDNWAQSGHVFVVADGIGGEAGGHIAARVTVDRLPDLVGSLGHDWDAIAKALSAEIVDHGAELGYPKPGSTFVVAVVHADRVVLAHAGDSRAYRYRDGVLRQLTWDHNLRSEILESGGKTDDAALDPAVLAHLTSSVGASQRAPRVDATANVVRDGDCLLLCTDGVHGQLSLSEINSAMSLPDAQVSASRLTAQADANGGADNATALVIEFAVGPEGRHE